MIKKLLRKDKISIYALATPDGKRCPVAKFIEKQEKTEKEAIRNIIKRWASSGTIPRGGRVNLEPEGEGIFAIRHVPLGIRIYCFMEGGDVIITTNGCKKKRNERDENEIIRAKRLRAEYWAGREES